MVATNWALAQWSRRRGSGRAINFSTRSLVLLIFKSLSILLFIVISDNQQQFCSLGLQVRTSKRPEAQHFVWSPTAALAFDDGEGPESATTTTAEPTNISDTFTQFPSENLGPAGPEASDDNNSEQQQQRHQSSERKRQRQQQPQSDTAQVGRQFGSRGFRASEADLLPFAQFNVQHPSFNELIRAWPPTTRQHVSAAAAASSASRTSLARYRQAQRMQQQQRQQQESLRNNRQPGKWAHAHQGQHQQPQAGEVEFRNYLNEDLDDSIVTADEGFEKDQVLEPKTWINYLGELGDFIYAQLKLNQLERQHLSQEPSQNPNPSEERQDPAGGERRRGRALKLEQLDELLDDFYYDQYENSQVLYYGPQLVREGDIFEIGCYMPAQEQAGAAEWSKSGRVLSEHSADSSPSPRAYRRADYLGAKLNVSLKVFEASLSDSGNYRCNRMSRKYHKLVVVPQKISTTQLYYIQQRLLSIVDPSLMAPEAAIAFHEHQAAQTKRSFSTAQQQPAESGAQVQLLPGYVIIENEPLLVNCNISDESILRRLRENPTFQLTWYKNGKHLRGQQQSQHPQHFGPNNQTLIAMPLGANNGRQRSGRLQQQQQPGARAGGQSGWPYANNNLQQQAPTSPAGSGRIQFRQANGRQLFIGSAQYSDAGDYLCSWARLPNFKNFSPDSYGVSGSSNGEPASGAESADQSGASDSTPNPSQNPLAAGSLIQLMAPVKLRPFKSTYHVRQGNELRLVCLAQRSYPEAQINWYIGNQLIDSSYLREHANEMKILNLQPQLPLTSNSVQSPQTALQSPNLISSIYTNALFASSNEASLDKKQLVEVNPIPISRQQMQLTLNSRGSWIEYRDLTNERFSIDSSEQQLSYLQFKLAQLTQLTGQLIGSAPNASGAGFAQPAGSQASLSVLVINSLDMGKHNARFACRATTRANTDEVTTVLKVQVVATIAVRPSSGRATLIPGQPLHFQCEQVGKKNANFIWYKRELNRDGMETLLHPDEDGVEIHNDRLTILKPNYQSIGDYVCRLLNEKRMANAKEFAVIKLRSPPYISDFDIETGHTGKSSIVLEGERLELICSVRDIANVNITWLKSQSPDDESTMISIPETPNSEQRDTNNSNDNSGVPPSGPQMARNQNQDSSGFYSPYLPQTFTAPEQNIIIERIDNFNKKLIIEQVRAEHRAYYVCMADNGVTERSKKVILIRVKDKLIALWPFLGIVAELFILFTIIHIWETQRAYKELNSASTVGGSKSPTGGANKRSASGSSAPFETVPLSKG